MVWTSSQDPWVCFRIVVSTFNILLCKHVQIVSCIACIYPLYTFALSPEVVVYKTNMRMFMVKWFLRAYVIHFSTQILCCLCETGFEIWYVKGIINLIVLYVWGNLIYEITIHMLDLKTLMALNLYIYILCSSQNNILQFVTMIQIFTKLCAFSAEHIVVQCLNIIDNKSAINTDLMSLTQQFRSIKSS